MPDLDHTHDPGLRSWVASANGHRDFPIQNLPFGVSSPLAGAPRGGIAIGDHILDLCALHDAGLLDDEAQAACRTCTGPTLNPFLALGTGPRRRLRDAVSALLAESSDERPALLHRMNDWSARDIQAWEYQPLGPFLSKSFQSTISPWIVTPEALALFRAPQPKRPEDDPRPLPYLLDEADQRGGALDLELEVLLLTRAMRERGMAPCRLSLGNALNLYWTPAQLLTHHASNGCNLNPGDLLGTGTISSPTPDGYGSLLEITQCGKEAVQLPSGETRRFLEDEDEIILRARTQRGGYAPIGFGECRGAILPAFSNF